MTRVLQSTAQRDFMRHIATDIPDPVSYARHLPLEIVDLLLTATFERHTWRIVSPHCHKLRRLGLMDFGSGCLTVFGMQVRRALAEGEA